MAGSLIPALAKQRLYIYRDHRSRLQHMYVRFSPIGESTARLIASASATGIYVVSWHYLLHLHCPIQINLTCYADSTNSASGVLLMTDVTVSFAAKLLLAGKFRSREAQAEMDRYD